MTDTETQPLHVDCNNPGVGRCAGQRQVQVLAMQTAVADIMTFAMTDVQVRPHSAQRWMQIACHLYAYVYLVPLQSKDLALLLQVITHDSGFGRIGGWLSGRTKAIWELGSNGAYGGRCTQPPVVAENIANAWSGI